MSIRNQKEDVRLLDCDVNLLSMKQLQVKATHVMGVTISCFQHQDFENFESILS